MVPSTRVQWEIAKGAAVYHLQPLVGELDPLFLPSRAPMDEQWIARERLLLRCWRFPRPFGVRTKHSGSDDPCPTNRKTPAQLSWALWSNWTDWSRGCGVRGRAAINKKIIPKSHGRAPCVFHLEPHLDFPFGLIDWLAYWLAGSQAHKLTGSQAHRLEQRLATGDGTGKPSTPTRSSRHTTDAEETVSTAKRELCPSPLQDAPRH
ncbi:hypothetical protein B0H67DRAFT_56744 [Lasiosphaeris hirsuta]|uniref:Uncharacterized protein n=1 Tax=Lasiosphaeris hirsuta TaxID=260670 RepID=A0AA40BB98_9PEZI|nr:hypothetical protein B0H67DRAFT_56744 [Lasiosphaeris hirsuta]